MRTFWLIGKSKPSNGNLTVPPTSTMSKAVLDMPPPYQSQQDGVNNLNVTERTGANGIRRNCARRLSWTASQNDFNGTFNGKVNVMAVKSLAGEERERSVDKSILLWPPSKSQQSDSDPDSNEESALHRTFSIKKKSKKNHIGDGYKYGLFSEGKQTMRIIKSESLKKKKVANSIKAVTSFSDCY